LTRDWILASKQFNPNSDWEAAKHSLLQSPDGRWILFDKFKAFGGDIWFIDNFE
jgi:hypothetical protein